MCISRRKQGNGTAQECVKCRAVFRLRLGYTGESARKVQDFAGLKVKLSKSVFGRKYMSYLGHQVGNGKFAVPLYRVKSMKRYGKPQTKKQLRAFLGSIGYYRQFVRNK